MTNRKVILLFATSFEALAVCQPLFGTQHINNNIEVEHESTQYTILIGGVGNVSTCFELTRVLAKERYDGIVQLGIAGTYKQDIHITSVVQVIDEQFYHLGAEKDQGIETIFDMGLIDRNTPPFSNGKITPPTITHPLNLREVHSLSVGLCSNSYASAQNKSKQMQADIENMEGAACFYVAAMYQTPVLQLRSISNIAGDRQKTNWDINGSLHELSKVVNQLLTDKELFK